MGKVKADVREPKAVRASPDRPPNLRAGLEHIVNAYLPTPSAELLSSLAWLEGDNVSIVLR